MSTFTYTRKLFGIFPVVRSIPKPRLVYSSKGLAPCWICTNGSGYPGFGRTQLDAWNDWANWTLI